MLSPGSSPPPPQRMKWRGRGCGQSTPAAGNGQKYPSPPPPPVRYIIFNIGGYISPYTKHAGGMAPPHYTPTIRNITLFPATTLAKSGQSDTENVILQGTVSRDGRHFYFCSKRLYLAGPHVNRQNGFCKNTHYSRKINKCKSTKERYLMWERNCSLKLSNVALKRVCHEISDLYLFLLRTHLVCCSIWQFRALQSQCVIFKKS